jgi:hypothetical protein
VHEELVYFIGVGEQVEGDLGVEEVVSSRAYCEIA